MCIRDRPGDVVLLDQPDVGQHVFQCGEHLVAVVAETVQRPALEDVYKRQSLTCARTVKRELSAMVKTGPVAWVSTSLCMATSVTVPFMGERSICGTATV